MYISAEDEREYNAWRRMRKLGWICLLPWMKEGERGSEFDLFPLPGDPRGEELEKMKLKSLEEKEMVADELMEANREYMEELRKRNAELIINN